MRSNDPDSELKALQTPIAPDRMLVPCSPKRQADKPTALVRGDAKFLASLMASDMNAETVRSRRRAAPSIAVACYRAALARAAN